MDTLFSGTGVALITPMNADKSVDFHALKRIVNHCIEGCVEYLVVLGTTGEAATLSYAEKDAILKTVIDTNAGRVPIVLGLGGNETKEILDLLETTPFADLAAILSVTPYYNKPTQRGLIAHYSVIAEHCPIPVILYNIPGRSGINMLPDTVLTLAERHHNIVGVKEASGQMGQIMELLHRRPEGFAVISGDDALALPVTALGGDGVISVAANVLPMEVSTMIRAALAGNLQSARALHFELLDLINVLFRDGNPSGIKAALQIFGKCQNEMRLPLVPVTDETYALLQQQLSRFSA
ncbi:MAG: 4-hydroxy-tetrahydrodipicolinate synthase [Bacteroidales bacterium]|nr:4-hydroxy-tetrahydrodipicolinate synthase [Bacteroidales bacterium]